MMLEHGTEVDSISYGRVYKLFVITYKQPPVIAINCAAMTWSGQKSDDVLTDAYTECVRRQAVRHCFSVRYMSYERLLQSLAAVHSL